MCSMLCYMCVCPMFFVLYVFFPRVFPMVFACVFYMNNRSTTNSNSGIIMTTNSNNNNGK